MSASLIPLRYLADVRVSNVDKKSKEDERGVRLCNYTDVYYSDVITADRDYMVATASTDQISRFRLREGDTLITKDSETASDIAVSAYVGQGADDLVCGYHLAVLRPRPGKVDPRFLSWAVRSEFCNDQFVVNATGVTRYGLKQDAILGVQVPLPTVDEQRRIADFLDDQVARIDEVIRLREQQVEALKIAFAGRIRLAVGGAALAHETVDSNVAWIGPIHPDASIQELRRSLILQRGVDLTADGRRKGDYPVVTTGGIAGFHDEAIANGPGVVIGRYGTVGSVFWVDGSYWPHNTTLYVKDFKGNDRRYAYWLLRAFPYDMQQARAAVPGVNRNDLHPVAMPHLPLRLQQRAVEWIDTEERKVDFLCTEMAAQVGVLNERKRSLITAAVTGEFDVTAASGREVVAG